MKKSVKRAVFARIFDIILFLSGVLRIALACLNRASNDDHLEVSRLLLNSMTTGTFDPSIASCFQCYHPKLYHYVCAEIFYFFNISDTWRIIIAQLVNVAAGVAALYVIKLFVQRILCVNSRIRMLLFALVAFNPSLIKINVQATNDTFVISFGIIGSYLLYRFLQTRRLAYIIACSLFICFAILSKGNGLVLVAWAALVLSIWLMQSWRAGVSGKPCVMGIVVLSTAVFIALNTVKAPFSPYGYEMPKLVEAGTTCLRDYFKPPPLSFFKRSYVARSGVISIYDSYLSFPFLGLIDVPHIINERQFISLQRCSLWAQLYGRIHFSYFDQHVWIRRDEITILLGRLLMATALVPTLLLVSGFAGSLFIFPSRLLRSPRYFVNNSKWIFPLLFAGYIMMIIRFSHDGRDFSTMKDIYIFPGMLGYIDALLVSVGFLFHTADNWLNILMTLNLILLLLLYCLNSILVLQQLLT